MKDFKDLKIAVVFHPMRYWGGAALQLTKILEVFPHATVYTAWYNEEHIKERFPDVKIKASFMQKLPFKEELQQEYINLQPLAYRLFDFSDYDVVWNFSDGFDKIINVPDHVIHVLEVMTPPRFLWLNTRTIKKSTKWTYKLYDAFLREHLHKLWKHWDRKFARKADYVNGISSVVVERIKKYWDIDAEILHTPAPVDDLILQPDKSKRGDWYVYLGGVETYKGVELAIRACIKSRRELHVYGKGQDLQRMKDLVAEQHAEKYIRFFGYYEDEDRNDFLGTCRAAIIPAKDEDFGITFVEPLACGAPVIAYPGGGAQDILTEEVAEFFHKYSVDSLIGALDRFESHEDDFDPAVLRARAEMFSSEAFKRNLTNYLNGIIERRGNSN